MYRELEPHEFTFKKSVVIDALKENMERYASTYETLVEGFKLKYEKWIQDHSDWTTKKLKDHGLTDPEPVKPMIPSDRTETYTGWIAVYEDCVVDVIVLTHQEYCQQVLDRWEFVQKHIRSLHLLMEEMQSNVWYSDAADGDASLSALTAAANSYGA